MKNLDARSMAKIALFAALTAVGAQITIPAPIVPFTLQTMVVMLSGLVLGARDGMLSQIVYATLGLLGAPVFSNFQGGVGMITRPSFGFILGFIACAYITGFLSRTLGHGKLVIACAAGLGILYLIGVPYMFVILKYVMSSGVTVWGAIMSGFILFVPAEAVKTAAAVAVSAAVMRRFRLL